MEDRIQSCAMESGFSALAASRHCKRAFLPKQVSRKVLKERLMRLVGVIAEELETDIEGVGSTPSAVKTWRVDSSQTLATIYYLTKAEYIRHKDDIDLAPRPAA